MEYKIIATSRYGKEVIDTADSLGSAEYLQAEYRMAFGSEFTITIEINN
jgi:hypothetical protein